MKLSTLLTACALTILAVTSRPVFASGSKKAKQEPSVMDKTVEKTQEMANDASRAVKKASRKVEDKACEMINGKLDCAAQEAEHAAKNLKDKVEDATE